MEERHRRAIRQSRVLLVNDLNPIDIYDHLLELEVFNPLSLEIIQSKRNRIEEVQKLLDDIPKRGPYAYEKFLTALNRGGYSHLAEQIRNKERDLNATELTSNNVTNPPSPMIPFSTNKNLTNYLSPVTSLLANNNATNHPNPKAPSLVNLHEKPPNENSGLHVIVTETGEPGVTMQSSSSATSHLNPTDILDNTDSQMDLDDPDEIDAATESRLLETDVKQITQSEPIIAHPEDDSSAYPTAASLTETSSSSSSSASQSKYQEHRLLDECYKMESDHRGLALVICNKKFSTESRLDERTGADQDWQNLEKLFHRLKIGVRVEKDLKASEIRDTLLKLSHLPELALVDSLIVVLMSHGKDNEEVYGTDGQVVAIYEILDMFTPQNCPMMNSKPKLFIVNACRGERVGTRGFINGINLNNTSNDSHSDAPIVTNHASPVSLQQHRQSTRGNGECNRLGVNHRDIILAHSTFPGHVSYRDEKEGSWFIQAIVKVFEEKCERLHVLDLLIQVNRMVASIECGTLTQTPFHNFSTLKSWYLNPPLER